MAPASWRPTYRQGDIPPLENLPFAPFELFWDANRGNEHKQSRALGLLEKQLLQRPADVLLLVCKACLLIQMSDDWERAENRDSAISVALKIIRKSSAAVSERVRFKIEFAVGISLAQMPSDAGFDTTSIGILEHLIGNAALSEHFDTLQQQEVFVALGALYQVTGDPARASDAFIQGRQFGLARAADTFDDYQKLKSAAYRQ